MALSEEKKAYLNQLRQDLVARTGPKSSNLEKVTNEVDLTNISVEDLKALTDSRYTIGVDFNAINTSGKFTTTDMNNIAPGSIDVGKLKSKLSNQSMLQARVTDIVETQSGTMAVKNELRINSDVDDIVESKTKSQGVNMQLVMRSEDVDAQRTDNMEIKSRFVR